MLSPTRVLANALQKQGFDLVGGGTDSHLMLIEPAKTGVTGKGCSAVWTQRYTSLPT